MKDRYYYVDNLEDEFEILNLVTGKIKWGSGADANAWVPSNADGLPYILCLDRNNSGNYCLTIITNVSPGPLDEIGGRYGITLSDKEGFLFDLIVKDKLKEFLYEG